MRRKAEGLIMAILLLLVPRPASADSQKLAHHDIKVALDPEGHRVAAEDWVTLPGETGREVVFDLHRGLNPSSPTPGVRVVKQSETSGQDVFERFNMILPPGQPSFVVTYGGEIHHPLEAFGQERARGFKETRGTISSEGVFLSGGTFWYPTFDERFVTFRLEVQLPSGWEAVSQGRRAVHSKGTGGAPGGSMVQWDAAEPQEEIYLVAAPFTEYSRPADKALAMVFLRAPDEGLAGKYLDATVQYLAMYEQLIGPYPYSKFALVENFWESGYGMPSFTLLGPRIIRFPFIVYSSFPHEILHNWWGNGVYPEYEKGNWSEGLTAYLSDHLMKEMRGEAVAYRQETLQKYTDYVSRDRDFPLTDFRSRHSSSSEAVGYGKSLMFFHMLRLRLGDKDFVRALQKFYAENRFRLAGYDDLRKSFEEVAGKSLANEFDQWITRSGAPELKVGKPRAAAGTGGYVLTAALEQVQPGQPYALSVPVAVTMEGQARAFQTTVSLEGRYTELRLTLPSRPLRLDMDPEFDVFRRAGPGETPPALTQAFGAKKTLIVLPSGGPKPLLDSYRRLAQTLAETGPDEVELKSDKDLSAIPSDQAVMLLGWTNRFLPEIVSALAGYDVKIRRQEVQIGSTTLVREDNGVVLTARRPSNPALSLTWVAFDVPEAFAGLQRKLPHYHKYSYLGFQGDEPENVLKGRWPVRDSPMTVFVPGPDGSVQRVKRAKLSLREPLISLPSDSF